MVNNDQLTNHKIIMFQGQASNYILFNVCAPIKLFADEEIAIKSAGES